MGAKAYLVRTRLEWLTMLAMRGLPEDAARIEELRSLVVGDATRLGLPALERRARAAVG
jgi:hypothetical protein